MANENGEWIMRGLQADDPGCLHTSKDVEEYVNKVGFLPLFRNSVDGFSVEEHVESGFWWSGNEEKDPWEWRRIIASHGEIAYGKFFDKKAGFISKEWLPYFVNARRDGYDFDSLWDDELASRRMKKIMDVFDEREEIFSFELKEAAGFGKGGEKNFEGIVTDLMMKTYLCVRDFRQKENKRGEPYGWHIAIYTKPETLFGSEFVRSAYKEAPETSRERIIEQMKKLYPGVSEKELKRI
ncbi:MAG: hypothetical protein MJ096_05945 [Clostridia bacterium]|nr:hypothetical protein [Clostridia bacterium]